MGKEKLDKLLRKGIVRKGDDPALGIEFISWGIGELDAICGGGVPRGRLTVLVGEYSSGKTFLLQTLTAHAQKEGLSIVYVDTEKAYDPRWWERVGVETKDLAVVRPTSGEEASDIIAQLVRDNTDLVLVDSVAGLVPSSMLESDTEQTFIGLQARLVQRLVGKVVLASSRSAVVMTNQLRSTLAPGPQDNMPGGMALRYFAHLVLRVSREGWITEEGDRVGFYIRVTCRKNKVGSMGGSCLLPFYFRGEIDTRALLVERAIEAEVIRQSGPWYELPGGEKVMGKVALLEKVSGSPELEAMLRAALGER